MLQSRLCSHLIWRPQLRPRYMPAPFAALKCSRPIENSSEPSSRRRKASLPSQLALSSLLDTRRHLVQGLAQTLLHLTMTDNDLGLDIVTFGEQISQLTELLLLSLVRRIRSATSVNTTTPQHFEQSLIGYYASESITAEVLSLSCCKRCSKSSSQR